MNIALCSCASLALVSALPMSAACGAAIGLVVLVNHVAMTYLKPLAKAVDVKDVQITNDQKVPQPALSQTAVEVIRIALGGTILVAFAALTSLYSGVAFLTVLGEVVITYDLMKIIKEMYLN